MRFLLFNVVVLGALFYLFTADKTDIRAATAGAHAVVSRAGALADQAVDKVNGLMGKAAPEVQAFASEPKPAETLPPVSAPATSSSTAPAVAEKAVVEESSPAIQPPPAAPESKEIGRPANAPTRLVAGEVPEHWVPERPTSKVDPATAERLLAAKPAEQPAKTAATGKTEIAIAKGETLMSPRERRRELATLAEDMELLSLKKLSR